MSEEEVPVEEAAAPEEEPAENGAEAAENGAAEVVENGVEAAAPQHVLMTDSFDGMVKLEEGTWKCDGAPNWRRMPGFPIYGTGQPAQADLEKCLEQVTKKYDEQKKVLWVNLRQEPVVYVNGKPYSLRMSDNLDNHIVSSEAFEINNMENTMAGKLKKAGGEFKYFTDKMGEHLREMVTDHKEEAGKVEAVATLSEIYSGLAKKEAKLESLRIPMNLESAPLEDTFDLMVRLMKSHSPAVPVVFSCQGGLTRTTVAIVIAAIIKEAQLEAEFTRLKGVVPDCVIDELREKKLGLKEPEENGNKTNAIMLGNFDVVEEMIAAIPEAKTCKLQVDKLIDVAGPPKGCENLRELIAMDKMKFDVAGDDFAKILKAKVEDQIERYATIIAFAVYCKQIGTAGFTKTFKKWMDEQGNVRDMIQEGKTKLQWDRKIPDEEIESLRALLDVENFDSNLPQVINKINQASYRMFGDLPRGDQKSKSMRKLAGKTLLEVLPQKLVGYLETKLNIHGVVPDFYEMVGQLSYYGKC